MGGGTPGADEGGIGIAEMGDRVGISGYQVAKERQGGCQGGLSRFKILGIAVDATRAEVGAQGFELLRQPVGLLGGEIVHQRFRGVEQVVEELRRQGSLGEEGASEQEAEPGLFEEAFLSGNPFGLGQLGLVPVSVDAVLEVGPGSVKGQPFSTQATVQVRGVVERTQADEGVLQDIHGPGFEGANVGDRIPLGLENPAGAIHGAQACELFHARLNDLEKEVEEASGFLQEIEDEESVRLEEPSKKLHPDGFRFDRVGEAFRNDEVVPLTGIRI